MPAPFSHKSVAELVGSWPISIAPGFVNPQIQPNAISNVATILGIQRQPTGGFDLSPGGLSLNMYLGATPTLHVVDFPNGTGDLGGNLWSVAGIIDRFTTNASPAAPAGSAVDSDGFLELRDSANLGSASRIRLESITGAEAIFNLLGLFSEAVAVGGDIRQAQHIDPSRQIAGPGQLGMMHGERFSSDVINRLALQLGINVDRLQGFLDEKRVAVRVEEIITGNGGQGYQLNTVPGPNLGRPVFTGNTGGPTTEELMDTIQILDLAGNEFTREMTEDLTALSTSYTGFIETASDGTPTGRQIVDSGGFHAYAPTDPDENVYVHATVIPGHPLDGKFLKILDYISADQVVVSNIDPATGAPAPITGADGTWQAKRVRVHNVRAEVEGFFASFVPVSTFNTSLEQTRRNVTGTLAVTRVEKNNRIFVAGASFISDGVAVGDHVDWTGAASSEPYTNNATYRVARVIDEKTLELFDVDFGPVYLNPNVGGGLGDIQVKTDGDFHLTPFIKLSRGTDTTTQPGESGINFLNGRGAFPDVGQDFKVSYMVSKTLREALTDDPSLLTGGGMRFANEATSQVQQILMKMAGPAVETYDQLVRTYLYTNEGVSHEKHESRLDSEHYEQGRHSTIRPDVIDMWPEVAGATAVFRGYASDSDDLEKWSFLEHLGGPSYEGRVVIKNDGRLAIQTTSSIPEAYVATSPGRMSFESITESNHFLWEMRNRTSGNPSAFLKLSVQDDGRGNQYKNVLSFTQDGRIGINMADRLLLPDADTGFEGEAQVPLHIRARHDFPALSQVGGIDQFVNLSSTRGLIRRTSGDAFTADMVNRDITITGSASNNDTFRVVGFNSATEIEVYTRFPQVITSEGPAVGATGFMAAADLELLRLEGFSDTQSTVAIGLKPQIDKPLFSFFEVDEDSGNWFTNFAITDTMLAAGSAPAFRFVLGSAAGAETFRIDPSGVILHSADFDTASTGNMKQLRWWFDDPVDFAGAIVVNKEAAGVTGVFRMRMFTDGGTMSGLYVRSDGSVGVGIGSTSTSGLHVDVTALGTTVAGIFESSGFNQSVLRFFNNTAVSVGTVGMGADQDELVFRAVSADRYKMGEYGISIRHTSTPTASLDFGIDLGLGEAFTIAKHIAYVYDPFPTIVKNPFSQGGRRVMKWIGRGVLLDAGAAARLQIHYNRFEDGQGSFSGPATWDGNDLPGIALSSNAVQNFTVNNDDWDRDDTGEGAMVFLIGTNKNYKFPGNGGAPSTQQQAFYFRFAGGGANPISWTNDVLIEPRRIAFQNYTDGVLGSTVFHTVSGERTVWYPGLVPKAVGRIVKTGVGGQAPNDSGIGYSCTCVPGTTVVTITYNTVIPGGAHWILASGMDNGVSGNQPILVHVYNRTNTGFSAEIQQGGAYITWSLAGNAGEGLGFATYVTGI